jgi:sugar lactone lactonase YvrE
VYVTGRSYGSDSTRDYATVAYDAASGSRIWLARLNVANGYPEAIGVSPDGSQVFVTGTSGPSGDSDYTTVAYGALAGAQRWVARYDGANTGLNQATALAVSPDGARLYVTGLSLSARTEEDYATLAYEASTGRELWVSRYDGGASVYAIDYATAIAASPDGSVVYVTGRSTGPDGPGFATLAYGAASGEQVWLSRYLGPDVPRAMALSPDGSGLFVTGTVPVRYSDTDYATVAYDAPSGTERWAATYDGPAHSVDAAHDMAVSSDGQVVYVTGESVGRSDTADFATLGYATAGGMQLATARYGRSPQSTDGATAVATSQDGRAVYVTGVSANDYATIAYEVGW